MPLPAVTFRTQDIFGFASNLRHLFVGQRQMTHNSVCAGRKQETYICDGIVRPPNIQSSSASDSRTLGDLLVVQRCIGLSENSFNDLFRAAAITGKNARSVLDDTEMTEVRRLLPQQCTKLFCRVLEQVMHKRTSVIFAPTPAHAGGQ